jgi:hypothetical protein
MKQGVVWFWTIARMAGPSLALGSVRPFSLVVVAARTAYPTDNYVFGHDLYTGLSYLE